MFSISSQNRYSLNKRNFRTLQKFVILLIYLKTGIYKILLYLPKREILKNSLIYFLKKKTSEKNFLYLSKKKKISYAYPNKKFHMLIQKLHILADCKTFYFRHVLNRLYYFYVCNA